MGIIELDDEDIRAVYMICDYALRSGGLNILNATTRIIAKLPAPTEEAKK